MIRWCAYCQRYQGQVEPFDDYSMTHGICEPCRADEAFLHEEPSTLVPIRQFFARVANGAADPVVTASELVSEGTALGLDPVDLLLGIVQPVLRQIGSRWQRSEATIAQEHRITALCSTVVQLLVEADSGIAALRQTKRPAVLLVAAENNYHTLGVQILDVLLLKNRVSVFTVYPGLPSDEVVKLVRSLRPRIVAISVALREHVQSAAMVAQQLAELAPTQRPLVVVGGLALPSASSAIPVDGSLVVCRDLDAFVELASAPPPSSTIAREHAYSGGGFH